MNKFRAGIYFLLLILISICALAQTDSGKREKKGKESRLPLTSHVILISIEGLRIEDINNSKLKLPTLRMLRDRGASVLNLEGVYPSNTMPSHATMVTGLLPSDHGITSDAPFDEKNGQTSAENYRAANEIKAETIWQTAKRAGLKTAAVNFPLTEKADIDLVAKESDSTIDLIEKNRPQLSLVRFDELANAIRQFGLGSIQSLAAMEKFDASLKTILDTIERRGWTNETTLLLVSSHGYANVDQVFRPNVILARKGFSTTDRNGKITSWIATTRSSGGAAAIYLQDVNNEEMANGLKEIFSEIHTKDASPIWRILTKKDATKVGADPRAAIFLEAAPGFVISEQVTGKKITDKINSSAERAVSGYLPSRSEMRGLLIGVGKGIKTKTQIEYARLVDIAPTIARLLGLEIKASRGHTISAMLVQ